MAGIYNGHILEFPQIRVDCFTSPPRSGPWLLPSSPSSSPPPPHPNSHLHDMIPAPNAQIYLLTHVHTDHLTGLHPSFKGKIICSEDTKRMLLRLEGEIERGQYDRGIREGVGRRFQGLGRRVVDGREVDWIEALPYGQPKEYVLGYEDGKPNRVTITLLDANHCPGSTMFLITSPTKAVLHTGDIRCDNLFMQSLRRNPAVQEFIVPYPGYVKPSFGVKVEEGCGGNVGSLGGRRVLDRIYLDTGAILGTGDMPDREPVLQDLLQQISLYPPDTIFFLNIWCFGWEALLTEISRYFSTQIHVDRYKRSIYSAIQSNPYLMRCTTLDHTTTRFHACDRYNRCEGCAVFDESSRPTTKGGKWVRTKNLGKRVVSVNMVEVRSVAWEVEHRGFIEKLSKAALGEGEWPFVINCPIARHSPLPELQNLVKLFRPNAISPNTIQHPQALDHYLLPGFFKDCMDEEGYENMVRERDRWFLNKFGEGFEGMFRGIELDVAWGEGFERQGGDVKLGSGRRAHLQDQASRLISHTAYHGISSAPDKKISMTPNGVPGLEIPDVGFDHVDLMNAMMGIGRFTDSEVEYDTEDESPRKRRKLVTTCPTVKLESESVASFESSKEMEKEQVVIKQRKRDTVKQKKDAAVEGADNKVKAEIRVEEDIKPKIERHARPRFKVDREHLRALAMVAVDESQ